MDLFIHYMVSISIDLKSSAAMPCLDATLYTGVRKSYFGQIFHLRPKIVLGGGLVGEK